MRKIYLFMGMFLAMLAMALPMHANKVYYNNPNGWSTVKIYIYKGASSYTTWDAAPAMTAPATGNNLYSFDVPSGYEEGNVIFHNGSGSQYPSATGKALGGKSMVCFQDKDDDAKTIWAEYNESACKVYFSNTDNWSTVNVYYFGNTSNTWPGAAMTQNGDYYEYTVPAGTCGLVFNDGGSNQTNNLEAKNNYVYSPVGEQGEMGATVEDFTVYFDNSGKNWSTVCVHAYNDDGYSTTWPGNTMELGEKGLYSFTVDGRTTKVIFNNNNNGQQVGDFAAVANGVYNASGYVCLYENYTQPGVTVPETLYIHGTFGTTKWDPAGGRAMTKNGSKFTIEGLEIEKYVATDTNGAFSLAVNNGGTWDDVNGANRFGPASDDVVLESGVAADMTIYKTGVNASSCKSWGLPVGTYTIEADFETMKVTATKTSTDPIAGNGSLAIEDVTVNPGKDGVLSVSITTDKAMVGVQFDIEVPNVISAGTPLISRTMGNHTLTSKVQDDGDIRVIIFSAGNSTFNANEGTLMSLPFSVNSEAAEGEYTVKLKDIVFADADLLAVNTEDVTGKIIVQSVDAGSISLNKTVLALNVGSSEKLNATVLPEDAAYKTVTWRTDNESVATVDQDGNVTAVSNGTATITASCKTLSATCTVYVGKQSQTITWDQEINPIQVGGTLEFTATASSNLDVVYVITSGASHATLEGNVLTATSAGRVIVEARQAGNDDYAPAEAVAKTITINLNYLPGDVTNNGQVELEDATTTVSYILGNNPDPFNTTAADMNGDGIIDIVDVALIVNVLLEQDTESNGTSIVRKSDENLEQFEIVPDGYSLRVSFSNMENYIATMFDVELPEGLTITNALVGGSSHDVEYRELSGNRTRIVVISYTNSNFANDGYITLSTNQKPLGTISLNNAVLNSTDGANIKQTSALGATTVVSGIEAVEDVQAAENVIYNVSGIRVNSDINNLPAGLYIVNGKKIVVR